MKRELEQEVEIDLKELEELEELAWLGSNGNGGKCCNDATIKLVPWKD